MPPVFDCVTAPPTVRIPLVSNSAWVRLKLTGLVGVAIAIAPVWLLPPISKTFKLLLKAVKSVLVTCSVPDAPATPMLVLVLSP